MRLLQGPWTSWGPAQGRSAVTIGVLDGVHLGHRALLAAMDRRLTTTVLTFDPHPVEVLRPGTAPRLLTTIEERVRLLAGLGVGQVGVLDLSEIRELEPEQFVVGVLADHLAAAQVVVGADFRFGHDRRGDVKTLRRLGADLGFEVVVIRLLAHAGETVSSSKIRQLIEEGRVGEAATLLGSRFSITNTVAHGDRRGRQLGFPTANLRPPERKVIPATGVYACFASAAGDRHPAAVNVGVRPTFGGGELLIEAHLLDFDGDLYGEEMTVEFVEHLRPEVGFDTVEALVEKMSEDVAESRVVLDSATPTM